MNRCENCGAPHIAADIACRYCGLGRDGSMRSMHATAGGSGGPLVEILDVGPNAIMIIKVVREAFKTGLREAKDIVESPRPIRLTIDPSRARALVDDLVRAGAIARVLS